MGTNQFFTLASIPPLTNGPQTPIDLLALAPPTGLDGDLTFVCSGDFVGRISIEGSVDNLNWSVLGQFDGRSFGSELSLSPITITNSIVRYLRANVYGNTRKQTVITVGGDKNCDCTPTGVAVTAYTPIVDFTVAHTAQSFVVPLKRAGFYFIATSAFFLTTTAKVGTATGNLVGTAGNDPGVINTVGALTANAAIINSLGAFAPLTLTGLAPPGPNALFLDGANEIKWSTTPPAGITTFAGRFFLLGQWIPVS